MRAHREGAVRTGWTIRSSTAVPLWWGPGQAAAEVDAPDGAPLLEPDVGGAPDPDGGAPLSEPLPMFGQFLVEPELELELEPELEPELPLFELDEGVVVEPDVELVPEFPVVEVVAALATSAPPARSPEVSAPTARTLRKRMCMAGEPFCVSAAPSPCEPVRQTVRSGSVRDRRVT
jgi:hypothetical protein